MKGVADRWGAGGEAEGGTESALQHAVVKAAEDRVRTAQLVPRAFAICVSLVLTLVLGVIRTSAAVSVVLEWDAPEDNVDGTVLTDLAGYRVYYGTNSGEYTHSIDVGNTTSAALSGLQGDTTYYSAVKAYNADSIESDFSREFRWRSPAPSDVDSDADAIPDSWETAFFGSTDSVGGGPDDDPDGDGVSNYDEFVAGTSPLDGSSRHTVRMHSAENRKRIEFRALEASGPGYEGLRRHYSLVTCTNLCKGIWRPVPGYESILGQGQTVRYMVGDEAAAGCYRTRAWLE